MNQDPPLRVSDNDKPENLACDEDTEHVECDLKTPVLIPGIINICFTQHASVDLATTMWFYKTNN